jgi:hypothetical protein
MKSKKTVLIVIVIIVAVILLSVASWLIYKKFFKKPTEDLIPLATDDTGVNPAVNPTVGGGPSDVKAFQDWMDIYHPNWVKGKNLNKGSGYGTYGPSTQAAWGLWKDEFLKPAKLESSVNPYLTPFSAPQFGTYPVFNTNPNANPTSNVATGYNAIGKYAYTKGSYTNVRMEPGLGNFFSNTFIGQANSGKIGKIKAYQSSGLGINVPGWYQLDLTTTLVPSTAGLNHPSGSIPALRKSGYVREDGVVIQNS